jgi:hypothetical protein
MIDCAGAFYAEGPSHGWTVAENQQGGKKVDLIII